MKNTLLTLPAAGLFFLLSGVTGLMAAAPEAPNELKTVTLVCHWQAQAQFSGFYMAKEKGFYRRLGLDVKILHAETTASNRTALHEGKAQFITMFLTTAIKQQTPENKVVNIAQFFHKSSLLIVARKSSGILAVRDLDDRRIGIWYSDFEDVPLKFLAANRINGRIVMISNGINMFLYGGIDALTVTSYNELHALMMAGVNLEDLTLFRMNEQGFDIPEDGLYCREDYFNANKQLCLDFAAASQEGWKYAAQHQEETLAVVERILKENHLPLTRVHQQWMLRESLKLIFPHGTEAADKSLNRDGYYHTTELLQAAGKVTAFPRYDDFVRGGQ